MNPRVKAVMAVHVLGNSICMRDLMAFTKRHNLMLIEDTCESLGSWADHHADGGAVTRRMLGTFGDFGTYSFYFSHHITSGEGGMVVCQTLEDYNFVRCLRAHGWTRHLTNRAEVEAAHPEIDSRFLFVNVGFNLRPLEVQGAMLNVQLKKLDAFNACRRDNLSRIEAALQKRPAFAQTMKLMRASEGNDPAWFGIGALLHRSFAHQLQDYLAYLSAHGIENRPVISGNFVRQPCIAAYCKDEVPENYPGADCIHTRGFFIGVHQVRIDDAAIEKLADLMCAFPFVAQRVVLVTGAGGMLGSHVRELIESDEGKGKGQGQGEFANDKFIFLTRADGDLRDPAAVAQLFKRHQPTHVVHCAGRLASIGTMSAHPVDFWADTCAINNNVLQAAHHFQAWVGPIRVVSVLSTVMFPANAQFPVGASDAELYDGALHEAAEGYAFAKRALAKQTAWYRKQHGDKFTCVLPGNFFGAHGDFNPQTAPLANALIARAVAAADGGATDPLQVLGTGRPLRQLMWAADLARALIWAAFHYDEAEPLIIAGDEVSVADLAQHVCAAAGFAGGLKFQADSVDGPLRRTANADKFAALCPGFKATPLAEALKATVDWHRAHPLH